ncbi:MAG: response regulator [Dysgonomonas sp.]
MNKYNNQTIDESLISILMKISLFLIIMFFVSSSFICAQQIRHLGVDDGINGRHTFNIVQDKKGFVWISTRFGVDRYDGLNIKNYSINILRGGTTPIRLTQTLLDRNSDLWVYTDRGSILKYDESRDEFVNFYDAGGYLKSVFFDSSNNIWLASKSSLIELKKDKKKATYFNIQGLDNKSIKTVKEFDDDNMLIVTSQDVSLFNTKTHKFKYLIDTSILKEKSTTLETCYYDAKQKKLWVGTVDKGLLVYDMQTSAMEQVIEPGLYFHPILTIHEYGNDLLLIGTEGVGMYVIDKKTKRTKTIYNQWAEPNRRINGDAVYGIYTEKENNRIWLTTFSNGINIINFTESGFQTLKHEVNNSNTLCHDVVCDILEDSDHNIWFATENGISLWNKKTNVWHKFLDSKNIITLMEDSRGMIWASVYSSGVFVLDKQGNIRKQYVQQSNTENSIGTNFIYTIAEDSEGNIWTGGKKGIVTKLDVKTDLFTKVQVSQANYILPLKSGGVLISSESGIYKISADAKTKESSPINKKLKSFYVSDMYMESDSILWLATYGAGINRCNIKTGTVRQFAQPEGIRSNIIYALLFENNNLWFSTENGLGKLNLKSEDIEMYSTADGISGNIFRQLSRAKASDGTMYFGSYEGVTYFNPTNIRSYPPQGKIVFQGFSLFNQIIKPGDKDSPLKTSLENTKEMKLSYKQNSFSIDFSAIDMANRQNRKYMWKLDGLDQNWVKPTAEHIANYTNLEPKDYVFRVRYLDGSNKIIDEREIKITVNPPFWNTAWARILETLILAIIGYAVFLYVRTRIRKKQSEEKIKFFINTAHDIRTPLTLINSPLFQLKEEIGSSSPKTEYLFGLVTDNLNKLNKMFSQLLDFQKAYEKKEQLILRKMNISEYLVNKAEYWRLGSQKKIINIELQLPEKDVYEWIDVEKMDRILDNLVSNAIKYTKNEGGSILVRLISEPNYWKISVIDDGIGIPKKDRDALFKRFYRAGNAVNSQESGSGLGLMLVKQYVTLHKGNIGMNSTENKGSEFYIQFKHGKDSYSDDVKLDKNNFPIIDKDSFMDQEQNDMDKLKLKVLVVEDNDDLRTYLKLSLSHYYQISTAPNGLDAWQNIQKINPDIVVSDLQMPEMTGFDLCEKIKTTFETSHIPVILLTVVNDQQNITKGFNLGVDDYIEKPFDLNYLRTKIDNIIQNRKILRLKFLGIDKSSDANNEIENKLNNEFISLATKIIEDNITNTSFSISDFSKEMGLSRTLLYTKFNAITGYTPNDYIKIVRMNQAIQYFNEKKYSINEVALMVGFDEAAYFSTCFKKIYGKSPKQFIDENIK